MKIFEKLNEFSDYQPKLVVFVAVAYLGAPMAGKIMCDKETKITKNLNNWFQSDDSACQEPDKIEIPLAYFSTEHSLTSSSALDSSITFPIV